MSRHASIVAALAASVLLTACGASSATATSTDTGGGGGGGGSSSATAKWTDYDRPAEYGVLVLPAERIVMRDGVELSVTVRLPADANGNAVQPVPVLLTQTGYSKSLPALAAHKDYFIERGYAHVSVDVRGTGSSGGQWGAFDAVEQADYGEVMDWVATQPWSNGRVGTWGGSFMGITQLFTAAHQHPAHKAVFAMVPNADTYRDIVFTGGQTNIAFIPSWMGLVTALGVIPAEVKPDTANIILEHVLSAVTNFQVPTIAAGAVGLDGRNYDGPFWRTRSPIEVADRIKVPVFLVGGLSDIFQRSVPMLYEALAGHTQTKMLIGPWTHLDVGGAAGLPMDGVPPLDHIALQWFDRYVRGMNNGAERQPKVTQYYYGEEHYSTTSTWPHPQARAERWHLRADRSLTREAPAAGEGSHTVLQQPVNGICSGSTAQWTAGALGLLPLPCVTDNRFNEALGLELGYSTPVMEQDYAINGPIQADLWLSSTASDFGAMVRVTDVAPNGASREITNGILTASLRQVDEGKSRYMGGQMIQPWHPFTLESRSVPGANTPTKVSVEVFPTSFVIKSGHRLRITVGASDFPHGLPPVLDLADQLAGLLTILSDAEHPSSVVVPVVPVSALVPPG